jgi:hypothetical protein
MAIICGEIVSTLTIQTLGAAFQRCVAEARWGVRKVPKEEYPFLSIMQQL